MFPSTQIFTLFRLNNRSLPWQYEQLLSGAAIAASILIAKRRYGLELDRTHDPLDAELSDSRPFGNSDGSRSISRKAPDIIVAAIIVLDDPHAVSHKQSPVLAR